MGVALTKLCVTCGHFDFATGNGVVEQQHSDVGKLQFDGINNLDT
jgi:hypothetical protein